MDGLSLLVIMTVLQGCHLQKIQVTQMQSVSAPPGSTVILECNFNLMNLAEGMGTGWFKWYRHVLKGEEVASKNTHFKGRVLRTHQNDFIKKKSANIVLQRVEISDTGLYICEVSVKTNQLIIGHGNGTFLNVTAVPQAIPTQNPIAMPLGVIGGILIIFILSAFLLKHIRKSLNYTDCNRIATIKLFSSTTANSSTKELSQIYYSELNVQVPKIDELLFAASQQACKNENTLYHIDNVHYAQH